MVDKDQDTPKPAAPGTPSKGAKWLGDKPQTRQVNPNWDRELIISLATASLTEQRRARRWGVFFKAVLLLYLFALLVTFGSYEFGAEPLEAGRHTAVVDVNGLIAASKDASAENIIAGLQAAYEDEDTAGVILHINSPGGSPVQAGIIYDEIRRLRTENSTIPLYAVVADVCASGGYYIAAAADRIYADKASIVGSIGVRIDSFGFVDAMRDLGVERRLMTAGESKGLLDPFLPSNKGEVRHVQSLLDRIHDQFINAVKAGRGARLKDNPQLFSGLIWTGEESVEYGLIDELASLEKVARDVIGAKRLVNFSPRKDLFERFADRLGTAVAASLSSQLQGLQIR
ncbi:MAG: S49 family peptidase [Gammaproteobacteria bacterium]|nr:S49 family peptidase [Gammaproteobacteria bacterium]